MNLLDKLTYWITSGLAIVLVPFFFACDDPSRLGLELESEDNPIVTQKMEFVLPASTIYIDSLRTDQFTHSIFGQYEDSIAGKATVVSYNQYNIYGGVLPGGDSLEYVSTILSIKVAGQRAQRGLAGEQIIIHEVNDTLYNQPVYLADRKLDHRSETIADYTFDYNPLTDSIIQIPLTDTFGQFLYKRLEKATLGGVNQDSLLLGMYHYPPLALIPGAGNKGLFSFDLKDDTTRIYVNMKNAAGKLYHFSFDFSDAHYSQIDRDRSSGKFSDIVSEYEESNAITGRTHLDMVNGIHTKLDLSPYLDFVKSHEDFIINRATISMEVVPQDEFSYIETVPFIRNYFIKSNGKINGSGVSRGDGFNNAILTEADYASSGNSTNILTMAYNKDNSEYLANVTLFTQVLADDYALSDEFLTEHLVITSPETISLGQTSFNKSGMKLTIFYTTLKD